MTGFFIFCLMIMAIWALSRTFSVEKRLMEKIEDMELMIRGLEQRLARYMRPEDKAADKKAAREEQKAAEKPKVIVEEEVIVVEKPKPVVEYQETQYAEIRSEKPKTARVSKPAAPKTPEWVKKFKTFLKNVDWEQFTGVKLFAWLGGIALFCGAVFFIKYSIEKNLIPPAFRLALGAVAGLGLVIWSLLIDRKKYKVTSHILAAGGIGLLYIVVFSATNIFHYLPALVGFILLALVSTSCFVLAVFLDGAAISALGALGAYAVPVLVSTGDANILTLFVYLAVVNAGLFEVVRRLNSSWLFLLSAIGTSAILAMGISSVGFDQSADTVTGVVMANLALYTVFLIRVPEKMESGVSVILSGVIMYMGALAMMAGLITVNGPHAAILATFASALGIALIYRKKEWSTTFIPYLVLTFVIMLLWSINCFQPDKNPYEYALFLLYAIVAGLGPVLLVNKHGHKDFGMKWFKVFPLAAVIVTMILLGKSPEASAFFWPMAIGVQLLGIFLYFIIGSVAGIVAITALTVINGVTWVFRGKPDMGADFYLLFIISAFLLCVAAMVIYRFLPAITASENLKKFRLKFKILDEKTSEWMAATPPIGAFVILGAVFLSHTSIQPHPGMATGILFLSALIFLGKRIQSAPLILTSLFAFVLAQACWMMKVTPASGAEGIMAIWSGALWLGSLAASFFLFRPAKDNPRVWQAWAVFELIQSLFLLKASSMMLAREYVGYVAVALFIIKLPFIIYLLKQLEDEKERNSILAFHGGVILFYLSCIPVLVLQREWLGLTLVFESTALLWLNRRIPHPGLPLVSALLAAAGLALTLGSLNTLESPDAEPILNLAVLSLVLATASLGFSSALAPEAGKKKTVIPYASFFRWIAIGLGFYLTNYMVADWFGTQQGAGRFDFHFLMQDNMIQYASYTILWLMFGAIIWRSGVLSNLLRLAGLVILAVGWIRVVLWPYFFQKSLILENPFFNPGLLVFIPALAVLAFLIVSQKEDEWQVNMRKVFIGAFVVAGLMAMSQFSAVLLQPGTQYGFFFGHNMPMSFITAFSWFLYGAALFGWPWKLERPFRILGIVLIIAGLVKTVFLPYLYRDAFGALPAFLNMHNALFVFYIAALVILSLVEQEDKWPFKAPITSRRIWGWLLGLFVFYVINIEVVKFFGEPGAVFTMSTAGKFSQQLAYSFSWLIYAMVTLVIGIIWKAPRARWAALLLFVMTSVKIFFMDLWRLGSLYRVASFIGLAVVLILVSFMYQKFLANPKKK